MEFDQRMTSPTQIQFDLLRHKNWLRSVIAARVSDLSSVEDILSEVFRDALVLGARWQEVESPGPWLYRIAIRKIYHWRRRQNRENAFRQKRKTELRAGNEWFEPSTPLDQLISRERRQKVQSALSELPGKYQEILTLKYVHGWNYEQICTNLGLELSKVTYRLRKARNLLRNRLKDINDEFI